MINLNTNLSSLITQRSLATSTQRLNQAIEQMTTGFKINHAKDNAANYNITTNMTTKIGAYMVAEDNCAMGLDLLATANGSLDQIADKLQRLRALAVQVSNGTYGTQSKEAINQEANAIVDEIERIYNTGSYNGVDLMNGRVVGEEESGFIKDVKRRDTSKMKSLAEVDENAMLAKGTYSISTADELAKLATMHKERLVEAGSEFVLAADIDLAAYSTGDGWTPIGYHDVSNDSDNTQAFKGTFDGNGYTISNLTYNVGNWRHSYIGLFGFLDNAVVKNINLTDVNIFGALAIAGIAGYSRNSVIANCCVEGSVRAEWYDNVAGIVGNMSASIVKDCYVDVELKGTARVGGIAGTIARGSTIENCYSKADITTINGIQGGAIAGYAYVGVNNIKDCYALHESAGLTGIFVGGWNPNYTETVVIENSKYNTAIDPNLIPLANTAYKASNVSTCEADAYDKLQKGLIKTYDSGLNLQVGVLSNESSRIGLELGFSLDAVVQHRGIGLSQYNGGLDSLDSLIEKVSAKQIEFGAAQNRLESALDEISVQYENLVSSRSTLRDADISEVSSEYIRQQILQQASATLMATANQSPSIALQLI